MSGFLHSFLVLLVIRSVLATTFSNIATSIYSSGNGHGGVEYNYQVYSLGSSGDINVDFWVDGNWQSTLKIPLSTSAASNSPLVAASWADATNANLRLYYINANNVLMEVVGNCVLTSCTYNFIGDAILNRTNIKVSTGSKLAATYVRNDGQVGLRVFYQDTDSHISELACDPGAVNCWVKSNQGISSDAGSSLASVANGNGGAALIYVLNSGFNGASQGSNVNSAFSAMSGPTNANIAFNAELPFSVTISSDKSTMRLYYVDNSKVVNEWVHQGNSWTNARSSLPFSNADTASSPIAAISFNTSSTRVYYPSNGALIEEALDDGDWYVGALKEKLPAATGATSFQSSGTSRPTASSSSTADAVSGSSSSSSGLSKLENIGIITGIITGIICAICAIGTWKCWRRNYR